MEVRGVRLLTKKAGVFLKPVAEILIETAEGRVHFGEIRLRRSLVIAHGGATFAVFQKPAGVAG